MQTSVGLVICEKRHARVRRRSAVWAAAPVFFVALAVPGLAGAQTSILDPVGQTVDSAEETLDSGTDTVRGAVESVLDSAEGVTNDVEKATGTVTDAVDPIKDTVDETIKPVTDIVDEATTPVTDPVDTVTEPVRDAVDDATGRGDAVAPPPGGGGTSADDASRQGGARSTTRTRSKERIRGDEAGVVGSGRATRRIQAKQAPAPARIGAVQPAAVVNSPRSVADVLAEASRAFRFPLLLAAAVALFLAIQSRLDGRAAKLVAADEELTFV